MNFTFNESYDVRIIIDLFCLSNLDMESARCPQPKIPSPTTSVASKGEQKPISAKEESPDVKYKANEVKVAIPPQQVLEKVKIAKLADASEATLESMSVKEPASQGSALLAEEEVQQKVASGEAGNDYLFLELLGRKCLEWGYPIPCQPQYRSFS